MTQVKVLLDSVDAISTDADEAFARLDSTDKCEYSLHLGYGSYITCEMFLGQKYYDIRRYWLPPNGESSVPTAKGSKLRQDEFTLLKSHSQIMYSVLPELYDVEECQCLSGNQLQFLTCTRCNPFDCLNWF